MRNSPFIAVLKRELHRMTARRIYIIASVVLPLFSVFFMATIFGTGQMQNLPVGVVDYNNSATSRNLVRMVEADPTFDVLKHYGTDTEARSDVQRKYIYAYLSIPPEFESKVGDGKKVALTYYYHYALLSVGTDLKGGFQSLLKTYSAAPIVAKAISLGIDKDEIESFLLPISTQNHPLFNPDMNYSVYLTQPFYYVFFQVLLLLITIYSLGSEGKFHTSNEWLKTADNNIFVAVVAKLLPYTIIFICISIFANYFFFVVKQIPMHCSFLTLNLITVLFIFATQALGIFLFSLFPAVGLIISAGSMVGSLGATLGGVTFPVPFMYTPIYYLSFLFPIRHYVEISHTLLYGNYGFPYMWINIVILILFLIPPLIMLPHLKKALVSHKYDEIE